MKNLPKIGIQVPDVFLPKPGIDLTKWSVIACDQYTSEPEYWEKVREIVGHAPSTFNIILPEVFLGKPEEEKHIALTHQKMSEYLDQGLLIQYEGIILVERMVDGKTRHGLVLALDLEQYDYNKGSQSLIRATEGTILQRLPPRIKIREGAQMELPHILVLIDDPENTVIEPILAKKQHLTKLYDFDLMLGSGHLTGHLVNNEEDIEQISEAFEKLASPETFYKKYDVVEDKGVLLFAMGDGNHSLATAKAIWEKIKSDVGMNHPARYALVEIENIHDAGLEFEPIHRVLFNTREDPFQAMQVYFGADFRMEKVSSGEEMIERVENQSGKEQAIGVVTADLFGIVYINHPKSNLPVGTIQSFLDEWMDNKNAEEIDYVHGSEPVLRLGSKEGNLGVFLPAMQKSELFKTVILDGALPRKTFSMGEAHEKRFYMECRKIK